MIWHCIERGFCYGLCYWKAHSLTKAIGIFCGSSSRFSEGQLQNVDGLRNAFRYYDCLLDRNNNTLVGSVNEKAMTVPPTGWCSD